MDILQLPHRTNNWMERLKYSILCTRIPDPTEYTKDTRTDIVSRYMWNTYTPSVSCTPTIGPQLEAYEGHRWPPSFSRRRGGLPSSCVATVDDTKRFVHLDTNCMTQAHSRLKVAHTQDDTHHKFTLTLGDTRVSNSRFSPGSSHFDLVYRI